MLKQETRAAPAELLWRLHTLAEKTDDVSKCLRISLRELAGYFAADSAAVALVGARREPIRVRVSYPKSRPWSLGSVRELLGASLVDLPRPRIFARLERWGRSWAIVALSRPGEPFGKEELRMLRKASEVVSRQIARIDAHRITNVRARIDRKLIEQLQPNDLFYQILHGIRSLTRYDHSSALYMFPTPIDFASDDETPEIRIVAELLKPGTKSPRVNATFDVPRGAIDRLASGRVHSFRRDGDRWSSETGLAATFDSGEELGDYGRERSMIVAPLVSGSTLLGALKIAFRDLTMAGAYETGLVRSFLPHIVVSLQNLRSFDHLRRELDAAREFQQGLLPAPQTRLRRSVVSFRSRPCEQLGGDFFDVLRRGRGAVLLLTDVSGHGAKAAMSTALIKGLFRDEAPSGDPGEILAAIWRGMRFFESTLMVTAVCLEIDEEAKVLRYANAGHPRPLVRRADGSLAELAHANTPIFPAIEGEWRVNEVAIEPGSRILGYTDGIIESEHEAIEFGVGRLQDVFRGSTRSGVLDEIFDAFDRHRGAHPQEDDCTLFLVDLGS